ncbi:Protein FAM69C [Trichuris trichiura]|uniref:Protein FAM69C n=1 Tax=Trichuris trichiura TaxID=36087 RepID=A0A077Z008_TRITR|nr:Protein FAM69C [Trichuris trichiura]
MSEQVDCMARLKVRRILYAALLVFLLLIYLAVISNGRRRSAMMIVDALCQRYKEGKLSGSYCEKICSYENLKVFAHSTSNKAVIRIEISDERFLLKSAKQFFDQFDMVPEYISVPAFDNLLNDQIRSHTGLSLDDSLLGVKSIWPKKAMLTLADRRSIWALCSQEEYLNFKLLDFTGLFPKVIGTCGHMYAVPIVKAYTSQWPFLTSSSAADKFILTLQTLQYSHSEPLHWCDASSLNLGFSDDPEFPYLILDADMLYTQSGFGSLMAKMPCQHDSDCYFFDCKASCNRSAGWCSSHRLNSNVQVVCKKFLPWWYKMVASSNDRLVALCTRGSL